jgi:hypothetical protein
MATHRHDAPQHLHGVVSSDSMPSRALARAQEVTEQIRQKTGHLPGVAIAVMGACSA